MTDVFGLKGWSRWMLLLVSTIVVGLGECCTVTVGLGECCIVTVGLGDCCTVTLGLGECCTALHQTGNQPLTVVCRKSPTFKANYKSWLHKVLRGHGNADYL